MTTNLPYKVECKLLKRGYFETIAAFDCESAAVGYAGECMLDNLSACYRVKKGRTIIRSFGPWD